MEEKECKTCVNFLTDCCPLYLKGLNDYINYLIARCGKRELGINCYQSEEDKILCDMMCGEAEDEY